MDDNIKLFGYNFFSHTKSLTNAIICIYIYSSSNHLGCLSMLIVYVFMSDVCAKPKIGNGGNDNLQEGHITDDRSINLNNAGR